MEPFIGQIILFGGTFAPRGWAFCEGQLLAISQNTALFSLLGTTYGGDGRTTFALPDLRGRTPVHFGRGPGLSDYRLGERGGSEQISILESNLPPHQHEINSAAEGNTDEPTNNFIAGAGINSFSTTDNAKSRSTGSTGGGLPVNNRQPYIAMNYIIALVGIFPSRS